MIGYKLLRKRKDDTLGPLFINRGQVIEPRVWLPALCWPTKGFAVRQGWHVMAKPRAPHLKLELASGEQREWWQVKIRGYEIFERPLSQGGIWYLADSMQLVAQISPELARELAGERFIEQWRAA